MKAKTFCRLNGLEEFLMGSAFFGASYYILGNIGENYSTFHKIIEYTTSGISAIGGLILIVDGVSDIITGLHHYGITKVSQILTKDKDKEIEKWINQMKSVKEKEFNFNN